MNNISIKQKMVIRQCLSMLPMEQYKCPLLNYEYDKLDTDGLIKIFVAAQLDGWRSYTEIEKRLKANPELCKVFGIETFSGSQLSRRINALPTELLRDLYTMVVEMLRTLTQHSKGLSKRIGILSILDATHLKLPENICDWAYVTKGWNVVKMHTRLIVASPDTAYPDKILPSTGNVSDFEGSDELIEKADVTYVMDRGYGCTKRMAKWQKDDISFVVRIKTQYTFKVLEEYKPTCTHVSKSAKIKFSTSDEAFRLVEFINEKGSIYRIVTTRWDLSEEEIMDIYKNRWMVETFFKWIKQNLKLSIIRSTEPQGIWNHMFIALIAYGLSLIVKLKMKTNKTHQQVLTLLRVYFYKTWGEFIEELYSKPQKTSKGRQKVPDKKKKLVKFPGTVAKIKGQDKKQKYLANIQNK
ncbi:IS4 family transposase [Heliorestis convoluta]|uniref:Transposase DDE domain protein n=1 Tax=Heliorestis convoluta TaxID=356322 RepID=A0A5Q2N5U7_9FIRM|nr:IS4 family transposase [Heliorestis convoluta]QGG49259.1 Transposase DDE domain protein [Heliorestis convoluta]